MKEDFGVLSPKKGMSSSKSSSQSSVTYAEGEVERLPESKVIDDSKETVSSTQQN